MGDNNNVFDRLSGQSADDLPDLFMQNIQAIYQYDQLEIREFLLTSHADSNESRWAVLTTTRQYLLSELQKMFPSLKEKELYKRKKMELMAQDVFIMGYSFVNKIQDKRLGKTFKTTAALNDSQPHASNESLVEDNTDSDLQETCMLLRQTVLNLESTVIRLSIDVKDLRHQLETQHPIRQVPPAGPATQAPATQAPTTQAPATQASDGDGGTPEDKGSSSETETVNGEQRNTTGDSTQVDGKEQPSAKSDTEMQGASTTSVLPQPFSFQREQKQQTKRGKIFTGTKRAPVCGSSTTLKTIQGIVQEKSQPKPQPKSVYVGRLSSSVTTTSLRKHLQEQGVQGISEVIDLKCRIADQASFCIVADCEKTEEALYNSSIWPQGAKIRPYEEKQKSTNPVHNIKPRRLQKNPRQQNNRQDRQLASAPRSTTSAAPVKSDASSVMAVPPFGHFMIPTVPPKMHGTVHYQANSPSPIPPISNMTYHSRTPYSQVPGTAQMYPTAPEAQNRFSPLIDPRYASWLQAYH